MSAFWNASDKIPVKQTRVAIPAENGLNFQAGGKINITIPPTVKFFQPKETFLSFDYLIGHTGTASKLQLDAELGGQVLIRDIRIFSGGAGAALLEEIQDYNVITAVRYDYEADATLRNKRALTEGATVWSNNTRGTRGNERTDLANVTHNPNHAPYESAVSYTAANDVAAQRKVKCLLPLHTGLFQNDKVFPSLLTEGLRLEIQLENAPRCLRVNDMTNFARHNQHACLFHSATSSGGTGWVADAGGKDNAVDNAVGTTGGIYNGYEIDAIWVRRDNNQIGLENFPISVGETFNIVRNTKNPVTNHGQTATGGSFDAALVATQLDWIVGGGAGVAGGTYGLVKITLSATRTFTKPGGGETILGGSGGWSLVSTDIQGLGGNDNDDWTTRPTITISDVELIVQQLEMPDGYTRKMMEMMKAGGTLNYDFLSATNYKHSQLAGDVVANIRLPLSQSRAKSIISVPTDSSVYTTGQQVMGYKTGILDGATNMKYLTPYDATYYTYQIRPTDLLVNEEDGAALTAIHEYTENNLYSVRSGITGIWDHMSHYQWFYDGRLNPSRRVETSKIANKRSITQQPLIELEKSLAMAGIRPLSFRKFASNAVIGRALSLQNGVYDTRGKDFNLQVSYEESDAPAKNKLWHNFVFHVRRLSVKGNQISINV
jgi:hypothetical protein